tara:strand:- start:497 stop:649 length:153 start_codon:yes stop_codon:yes gene_type:complete
MIDAMVVAKLRRCCVILAELQLGLTVVIDAMGNKKTSAQTNWQRWVLMKN